MTTLLTIVGILVIYNTFKCIFGPTIKNTCSKLSFEQRVERDARIQSALDAKQFNDLDP